MTGDLEWWVVLVVYLLLGWRRVGWLMSGWEGCRVGVGVAWGDCVVGSGFGV